MRLTYYNKIISTLENKSAWTTTYGLARSILGLGTLLTLSINSTDILFKSSTRVATYCDPFGISLYCIFDDLLTGKLISIGILFLVVIGWRPQITGIFHWWVQYSFINSALILDGGDHIAAIITILLIPLTLTDPRKSHWLPFENKKPRNTLLGISTSLIAWSCLFAIKIQVSIIYLNAAAGKLAVKEWIDGTALYYWCIHPLFGSPDWLRIIIEPLVLNGTALFIITWGSIIFEFLLFAGLLMDNRLKKYFLVLGVLFHFGIFIIHGLASFFFTMSACLILYLGPTSRNFHFPKNFLQLKNKTYAILRYARSSAINNRAPI